MEIPSVYSIQRAIEDFRNTLVWALIIGSDVVKGSDQNSTSLYAIYLNLRPVAVTVTPLVCDMVDSIAIMPDSAEEMNILFRDTVAIDPYAISSKCVIVIGIP